MPGISRKVIHTTPKLRRFFSPSRRAAALMRAQVSAELDAKETLQRVKNSADHMRKESRRKEKQK